MKESVFTTTRRNAVKIGAVAAAAACTLGAAGAGAAEAEKAAGTVPAFMEAPEPISDFVDEKSYDVVVVGAGASGLAAALRAAEQGAKVAVVQKEGSASSQGYEATGLLADNDAATKKAFVSKLTALCDYRPKRELLEAWADNSGDAILWFRGILDAAGVEQQPEEEAGYEKDCNGYTASFITARPTNTYTPAVEGVAAYAQSQGVDFFYNTPAVQLVKDGDRVAGVAAGTEDGGYTRFNAAKAVILSTGDYQNNQDMLKFYLPDVYGFPPLVPGRTGDGHRMGVWAGGHLEPVGHTKMIHETWSTDAPFLMVDGDCERFCDEHVPWFKMNTLIRENMKTNADNPDAAWHFSVLDSTYKDQMAAWGEVDPEIKVKDLPELRNEPDNFFCVVFEGDTLDEIADMLGLDAAKLQETVDRYNEVVEQGFDDDFGKDARFLAPVAEPPFYLVWRDYNYGLSAVLGGLEVNGSNQVLDDAGQPIAGLYATGNVSGPFFGGIDYPMYFPGLSIGRAITTGYIAGEAAANA